MMMRSYNRCPSWDKIICSRRWSHRHHDAWTTWEMRIAGHMCSSLKFVSLGMLRKLSLVESRSITLFVRSIRLWTINCICHYRWWPYDCLWTIDPLAPWRYVGEQVLWWSCTDSLCVLKRLILFLLHSTESTKCSSNMWTNKFMNSKNYYGPKNYVQFIKVHVYLSIFHPSS